jgi:hypothetical protein
MDNSRAEAGALEPQSTHRIRGERAYYIDNEVTFMRIVSVFGLSFLLAFAFAADARADVSSAQPDSVLSDASKRVFSGQVTLGLDQIKSIFSQTNFHTDDSAYWKAGSTYIELLAQIEDTNTAMQIINQVAGSEINTSNVSIKLILQYYIGRNLFQQHKYDEAEKFLRALTGEETIGSRFRCRSARQLYCCQKSSWTETILFNLHFGCGERLSVYIVILAHRPKKSLTI